MDRIKLLIKKKWDLFLVVSFLCISQISEYYEILSLFEEQTIGIRQILRMSYTDPSIISFLNKDIVLITFNKSFYDWYNRYPIHRKDIARLVRNINQLNPKLIVVDLFFKYNSIYDNDDDELFEILSSANSILASHAIFDDAGQVEKIDYPLKPFEKNITSGYVNHTSTSNIITTIGRLRIFPEIINDQYGWPLAIQALAKYYNAPPELKNNTLKIGPHTISLNQFNEIYIDFPPIPNIYRYLYEYAGLPAQAFINTSTEDQEELSYWIKDKIVIIGDTFEFSHDCFNTPVGVMFGAEFIACSMSTIMKGAHLKSVDCFSEFLSAFLLLLLIVFTCYKIKDPRLRFCCAFLIFIAFFIIISSLYVFFGLIFALSYSIIAGMLSFITINLRFYLKERKLKTLAEKNIINLNMELEDRILRQTQDIKRAMIDLKESEEKYKGLYNSSKDGIFLLSKNLRFLDVNSAFEKMLGYSLLDIKQLLLTQITPYKWQEIDRKNLETKIFSKGNIEYEKEFIHADGYAFPVTISAWLLPDKKGKTIGIWGIAHDITDKKQAENLKKDVERMMRHDLKTPLNGLIGYTQLLKRNTKVFDKIHKRWINNIDKSSKQLLNMIDYSLDIYKMEEGSYVLKPIAINLVKLFQHLNEEMNNIAQTKNIILSFLLNNKQLCWNQVYWISGEEVLLANLFSNLIKNAIEASPENETVTISIFKNDMHEIIIHNKGIIPEQVRDNFFERYSTYGKKYGTGIGTYSASLITKTLKGDISFKTSYENGTYLIVRLPEIESIEF